MMIKLISIVMSGLFGTSASVLSDLNLVLQVALLVTLLAGFQYGKRKTGGSLKMHGRLMKVLVALNGVSILFVMGPSFFMNLGAVVGEISVLGFPLTLVHHLVGLAAEILGAVLVFKKFGKVRTWMRITFVLWLIALLSGIGFYVRYYLV